MPYQLRSLASLSDIPPQVWDDLLANSIGHTAPNPFLSHAFLHSLHESGAACRKTGWQPNYLTVWQDAVLVAAMPMYLKYHSRGEYVFDWAWAEAYEQHKLPYYPKLLSAIPFTPVTGARLIARDAPAQAVLLDALCQLCMATSQASGDDLPPDNPDAPAPQSTPEQLPPTVSSCHVLFPPQDQANLLLERGFMLRQGVQFHWQNQGYQNFEQFLATLEAKKRKNIRAERRKVLEAGVRFVHVKGRDSREADWEFFVRCYDRTYLAHFSRPYLNLDFFLRLRASMPDNLLLIIAEKDGERIAASLLVYNQHTLYGRYWGALQELPCLHFETAYYQPLEFCIAENIQCFEGGAQGEHKMARGFLPQTTWSAHWLAHPAFSDAVERFLQRESKHVALYLDELHEHNPFRAKANLISQ